MTTQIAVRSAKAVKAPNAGPGAIVQEALQVTWLLKGNLKNAQLSYIRVGILLARVRDQNLYGALGHADMESYAEERLRLGRTSLYKYLQVHDWIGETHPEWLKPKPKGFIPDLTDTADLMWIERELARKELAPKTIAGLEELRKKTLDGQLLKSDLAPYRRQKNKSKEGRKAFLSKLRLLRRLGSQLAGMPPEVISHLDAAVEILTNADALPVVGIDPGGEAK
jgi:hypothetical protein